MGEDFKNYRSKWAFFAFVASLPYLTCGTATASDSILLNLCAEEDSVGPVETAACQTTYAVNDCDNFLNSNPALKTYKRKCDRSSLVDDRVWSGDKIVLGCLEGVFPIQLAQSLLKQAEGNATVRQALLTAADQDLSIKRTLFAAKNPSYANISDTDLSKVSAATIMNQNQMAAQEAQNAASAVRGEQAPYLAPDADPPSTVPPLKPKRSDKESWAKIIFSLIEQKIHMQEKSWDCLDTEARAIQVCNDAASVLGTILPATAGEKSLLAMIKAAKGAKAAEVSATLPSATEALIDKAAAGVGISANSSRKGAMIIDNLSGLAKTPLPPGEPTEQPAPIKAKAAKPN
ncbi:MAG: hypothetical protein P4M08_02965 [Oligoflexia bacterium]|nr:hypothetical protein [Oligoflexia bacterium]